jgi:ubiquitin-like 1-activating enzyme E1 A
MECKRVDVAKSHIQNLNPLVTIEIISTREALQAHGLENLINGVDLVCLTDNGREMIVRYVLRDQVYPSYCV